MHRWQSTPSTGESKPQRDLLDAILKMISVLMYYVGLVSKIFVLQHVTLSFLSVVPIFLCAKVRANTRGNEIELTCFFFTFFTYFCCSVHIYVTVINILLSCRPVKD